MAAFDIAIEAARKMTHETQENYPIMLILMEFYSNESLSEFI